MASHTMGIINMKPSFAKASEAFRLPNPKSIANLLSHEQVAAMAPPPRSRVIPNSQKPNAALEMPSSPEKVAEVTREALPKALPNMANSSMRTAGRGDKTQSVIQGIEKLALADSQSSKEQPSTLRGHDGVRGGTDSAEDDQSHLSNSSTKGPSFDTKSMASATTFAMDEKESLRPDDSASVQAGDEEDHSSPHGSAVTNSQHNSDVGAAPARVQLRDSYSGVNVAMRRPPVGPMQNPPRFGDFPLPSSTDLSHSPTDPQQPDPADISRPPPPDDRSLSIVPDEKLLDAMGTPKDRLLLLQLEEMIIAFITQSRDEFLDLPPQNSFGRLLAHKLSDYYNLAHCNLSHYTNSDSSSVRLFRGTCCNLPTSLSVISSAMSANGAQSTSSAAFKIMRRGGLGPGKLSAGASTAPSSSVPSKTTSEAGADTASDEGVTSPADATPSKDKSKLTREEKEAHYKAARERIFGDLPVATESNSAGDRSASMSRSSSSSGKRKAYRQRAPKDDSFEARSQFVPGYGGMTYSAAPIQYQSTFGNAPYSIPYASSPGLVPGMGYSTTPTQPLPAYEPQTPFNGPPSFPMGYPQQYGSNDSWPSAQPAQLGSFYNYGPTPAPSAPMYPPNSMQSPPINQYSQPVQPGFPQMSQGWTQTQYHGLQQSPMMQNAQTMSWPNFQAPLNAGNTQSYPYGQLPPQTYGNNYGNPSQHPLPGSFNRSIFNPQTRSFVPANSAGRFGGKPGKSNQPKGSGRSSGGGEHAKAAEGAQVATAHSAAAPQPASNGGLSSKAPVESIQKKWGTPAHLPKKPPPSQVPPAFTLEAKPPLPSPQSYQSLPSGMGVSNPMVVSAGVAGFSGTINGGLAAGS